MTGAIKRGLSASLTAGVSLLDRGHVYLHQYKVIAIVIIAFVMWQCHILTIFYMENFADMQDWQNLALVGLIGSYVTILKFCLDHILKPSQEVSSV